MKIREVAKGDGEQLIELFSALDSETQFMMFEPGERQASTEQQEQQISDFVATSSKSMFIAVDETLREIAGFIVGIGGGFSRNKHSIYCVIGLRKKYSGQGIGRQLLNTLIAWAESNQFHRIDLTVMEHNEKAIGLYKSCGFEVEGIKRDSMKVDDRYINEFYMSKLI